MELANDPLCEPSASEANLHNEQLSFSNHLSSLEVPLDNIVHGLEVTELQEQSSGLELKLDLYVPAPPIIEPITPVDELVEPCALPVASQMGDVQAEAIKEGTEETVNAAVFHNENRSGLPESGLDSVTEVECEYVSKSLDSKATGSVSVEPVRATKATKTCANTKSSGCKVFNMERKNIPPKKDKFNPLKLDMAKVIPLTSSQISLQCLDCHIIFSDSKSRDRHFKMSHPKEYQQSMMGDVLFTCYVCDQHFTTSTELTTHQGTHTSFERFKCPFCSEAFFRSCELTSHKKKIHYTKHGYSCSECAKPFRTFTLLRHHQRVHVTTAGPPASPQEKPYVCMYKDCGKRFSTPKSLRNHLEKHEKQESMGDKTSAPNTTKKKKTKAGTKERKFPCSQCDIVFKTSKAQLLHIKTSHSQESQSSTVPQTKLPGPALTHAANGQLPTLFIGNVGPGPQQIDNLDPEQIKRLIEKLGNVQKVNQLVILPLQSPGIGLRIPQPLHVNFTESTTQSTQCVQSGIEPLKSEQGNIQVSAEMGDFQQKETEESITASDFQQKETEENITASENSERQETPIEMMQTEAQTQMEVIHLELIPIEMETSALVDQTPLQVEASQCDIQLPHAADQHIPFTQSIGALQASIEPPLIPQLETANSHHVPTDTIVFEEMVTNAETAFPTKISGEMVTNAMSEKSDTNVDTVCTKQVLKEMVSNEEIVCPMQMSEEVVSNVETMSKETDSHAETVCPTQIFEEMITNVEIECPEQSKEMASNAETGCPSQMQDSADMSMELNSQLVSEHEELQPKQAQNGLVDGEKGSSIVKQQYQSESLNRDTLTDQNPLPTPDQIKDNLLNCPFVKKVPTKKKRTKKPLADKPETKKASKVSDGQLASAKKVNTSSKVISTKKEKTKNKKLVRFGPSEKKKSSKPKVTKTPKTKQKQNQNQEISDKDQVPDLSQHENKLDLSKKVQKDKKRKAVGKHSGVAVKSPSPISNVIDFLVVPETTKQGKPQKRKIKNQNNLVNKSKSAQEVAKDETLAPVQKKKKQVKISEDNPPKKPKVQKPQNDDFKKNTKKSPKKKITQTKPGPDASDVAHMEKQALLLLKGHKQPQLKVRKLDATELEKSPPSKPDKKVPQKQKNKQSKSQKKKKSSKETLLEYQGEPFSFEMPSIEDSYGSETPAPKVVRKRKAPAKIDQEIALSPPYSHLTLGCQDCGKTFSEVSALQQHMASWHSAGKVAYHDETSDVVKKRVKRNEKCISPSVFEIHVASDWDMEAEVGEIVSERLSFPALSSSPSLTLASGGVEEKEQEGRDVNEPIHENLINSLELHHIPSLISTPAESIELTENASGSVSEKGRKNEVGHISETSCTDAQNAIEEEIKEELPIGVNLVMVGEQSEEEIHNISGVSHEQEVQSQAPVKDADVVSAQNVLAEPEIKQEEEEVLVRKVDDPKKVIGGNSAKKCKKGTGKSRGKRPVGRRKSTEKKNKKDVEGNKEPQECQVLYHLCSLDKSERKNKETGKNGFNPSETGQASSEEAPEEQVVFELDSVTTSVMDIVNPEDGSFETSRDGSSPGIILEKYLTARERNMENPSTQSQIIQLDTSKVTSAYTSSKVKIEDRSSNLTHHSLISSESRVQMFLVKTEDHLTRNDMFQALQPADPHRASCQDKASDKNQDGTSSDSQVVPPQTYSKQCIFYPVKEEEREHWMETPHADQTCLDSEELAEASSGIEDCEEIRVDSVQMGTPHLYTNAEEGDVSAEQQRTQGFLEFLSENSDMDEADNIHSEPDAETIVMSCYNGLQSTLLQNGIETSGIINTCVSPGRHTEPGRQLNWKPINYFNQYFGLDTWSEIAVCTSETSKLTNPVTEEEVTQYVGIHIAMGTLKFPSTKLYWEDYTRVPLISDAMSASRFSELTHKVKLVYSVRDSTETSADQQSKESNKDQPGQSNDAHNNKEASNCSNSKTNPLWKVMPLIRRVQDGCRAQKRMGSYGVDQYPLPFQRHPTHSLLHTVVVNGGGLVVDFNLSIDDSNRENVVEKMVSRGENENEGMVFLCKPELSTPSMLEHLLEVGLQSAGKVGGARGQIGDEFVSSDGKLKLFRCHHGFILSAVAKEKPRSTSLVSGFEKAIKAANLNRDLRSLYRTPCINSAVSSWPQSVLWDLIDLVLVNAWIQYKQDYTHVADLLSLMAFRLEVAKSLILSSGVDAQDSSEPPCPPAPKLHAPDTNSRPSQVIETPLPEEHARYDGFGHWPEQLMESEEAGRCRFGGCERTSRVRCLKCCVFLCISRNHNCFLKFHSQGSP